MRRLGEKVLTALERSSRYGCSARGKETRRKWRARNREKLRDYKRSWDEEHPGRRGAGLKKVTGRVCSSCDRSDSETSWSSYLDRCGACQRRGVANGFCPGCEQALYRRSGRASCACVSLPQARAGLRALGFESSTDAKKIVIVRDAMDLSLEGISPGDYARASGGKKSSARDRFKDLLRWIQRIDAGARIEEGRIVFNRKRVLETLGPAAEAATALRAARRA